jgi:hypothetical protein
LARACRLCDLRQEIYKLFIRDSDQRIMSQRSERSGYGRLDTRFQDRASDSPLRGHWSAGRSRCGGASR